MSRETFGEALGRVRAALAAAGIEAAGQEARQLVGWAAGTAPSGLLARADDEMAEPARARLETALASRLARVPLAHIVGEVAFHAVRLRSDGRALVPRSDSETLVETALAQMPATGRRDDGRGGAGAGAGLVADLGTGSGCLLLAVLSARPDWLGLAIEADPGATALAAENFAVLEGRVELRRARWADDLSWTAADLILSNPPYIPSGEIETLEQEVRDHDPRGALDGGADGLVAYREIISVAAAHARAGTPLVLEIGHDQAEPVSRLLESAGFSEVSLAHDLGGRPRVLSAVKNWPHDKEKCRQGLGARSDAGYL